MTIATMTQKVLFLGLIAAGAVYAAQPAPTKTPPKPAAPAKDVEREIPYPDLGRFIGKRVIVHSALGTVRVGTLTHYSQSQIDITLEGGAQISFVRDSIKSVDVPVAPEEPQGSDSAKKN